MTHQPKIFTHGGITYLHERQDVPIGQRYIWRVPDEFGVRLETDHGFEVIHERTLRFGAKAYELAGLHTSLFNAVISISTPDRDAWIANNILYSFLNDPHNQIPPLNPTYVARVLDALDTMMADATETDEPFIERGTRGSGHNLRLRLNPNIGIEDRRTPKDFDIPFD